VTAPPIFIPDEHDLPLDRFALIRRMLIAKRPHADIAIAAGVSEARVGRIAGVAQQSKPRARRRAGRR
jgi:hypothetical protein